jgi:GMP synthase (glutamine-hydrolysing)
MKRLLVFQHVPHEILGTFNPLLKKAGFRIRYINFGRTPDIQPEVEKYDGLIILGGPMCIAQAVDYPHLQTEIAAIRIAMEREMPVLGICLGAQLIAAALDAKVYPNHRKEIGWYDVSPTTEGSQDPLFRHFAATEKIFQWHGDTFDMPEEGELLATSTACTNQAFRYGERTYGLQFHLEVNAPLIERWLATQVHIEELHELESLHNEINTRQIRSDTDAYIEHSTELGARVFGAYIELFSSRSKRRAMPSR